MTGKNSYRRFLETTETIYKQEKNRQIIRMLLISTVVIFTIESLLMVVLELILNIPEPIVWYIDGLLLVGLLFPLNFIFIVQPMLSQIEEHRQTNLELVKSNEILGRFFEISDILIAYMDADFNFLRVNKAYANADQQIPEYYVGKNHFTLFPNEENLTLFQEVVDTGETLYIIEKPFEYIANLERGISYWDWTLLPIKNNAGKVIELILVLTDRTAHKKAQLALADSERRFRAVFNQTHQHILLLDLDGTLTMANQTVLDFTGSLQEEVIGKHLWDLHLWEDKAELKETLKSHTHTAAQGTLVRCELPALSVNADQCVMDIVIKPLLDQDDRPVLLIYEARDISQRVRTREEIKRLLEAEKSARQIEETLHSASMALSGSLNINTVLETLLDQVKKAIPFTSAHIELLVDEDHMRVQLERGADDWPDHKKLLGIIYKFAEVKALVNLLRDKSNIIIPDTTAISVSKYFPGSEFIGSLVIIPLLGGDKIIGVCVLEHTQINFFSSDMVQIASAITNLAAIAIQNAWLYEQVRDGREHLSALSRRLVEVQESERHYIARELHDEAGQALASLMMGLRLLEREGGDKEAVTARSRELKQIADDVLENLHRLAVNLRPTALDHLGLIPALRQYTDVISSQQNLDVQFDVIGEFERFSDEVETAVYRIVQEALSNVVRHSQATQAELHLERRDDSLLVMVKDNGIGFDPKVQVPDHLGMVGMRERADMLNGTITVDSSPGCGSTIILEVPCPLEL